MQARLSVLLIMTILLPAAVLTGQRRGRGPAVSRDATPRETETRGTLPAGPTTTDSPERGAGETIPPRQGYVIPPESSAPGTATVALIPSDPLDRAYWELYDRDKPVTLTGKVTKVDWTNPNAYIYIAANGGLWAIESGFIQFRQASVTPAVRVDETITVRGYLPREQPESELPAKKSPSIATYLKTNHLIRAGEITTVFGQKLMMGRPPTETEMAERLRCSALGC